jgi:hypothetical protein
MAAANKNRNPNRGTSGSGDLAAESICLIVDLCPATPRDPQGMHAAIWSRMSDYHFHLPKGKPLTVASYSAGVVQRAFAEALAAGVPCLDETYQRTFEAVPQRWCERLAP